jgi:hypothetical protein
MPMERVGRGEWITKLEFHDRLARWLRDTEDRVVGDPDAHRRTAWVYVRDGHTLAKLHADTTREAVAEYLELVRTHRSPLEWTVVPSATGQLTKIAFGPERTTIRNFHLYLDDEGPPAW